MFESDDYKMLYYFIGILLQLANKMNVAQVYRPMFLVIPVGLRLVVDCFQMWPSIYLLNDRFFRGHLPTEAKKCSDKTLGVTKMEDDVNS